VSYQPTLEQFEKWLENKMPDTWMTLKLIRHWKEKFLYGKDSEKDCCEHCSSFYCCPMPVMLCGNYRPFSAFDGSTVWANLSSKQKMIDNERT